MGCGSEQQKTLRPPAARRSSTCQGGWADGWRGVLLVYIRPGRRPRPHKGQDKANTIRGVCICTYMWVSMHESLKVSPCLTMLRSNQRAVQCWCVRHEILS
jgi:hypothetical protein